MPSRPVANVQCSPKSHDDLMAHRSQFLQQIRQFFFARDFLEVETPMVIPSADPSPHLDSFQTEYRDLAGNRQSFYLQTSPEFAMKRLVAHGYERVFQICKFFRNGEITSMHNPEFTGLEWYITQADYSVLMDYTEQMVRSVYPNPTLTYQGHQVDLASPWERLTVHESIQRYANYTLPPHITRNALRDACLHLGLSAQPDDQWDDLFFKIFLTYVDPHLGFERPVFLYDYPIQMAALSRAKPNAPHLAERVELYIAGVELANGYSELLDPTEQRKRWQDEVELRQTNQNPYQGTLDEGLLNALAWGMPPTAGIAFGLDRLLMLLRDAPTIQDVLPFPMKVAAHQE